jgi:hypothetical protein
MKLRKILFFVIVLISIVCLFFLFSVSKNPKISVINSSPQNNQDGILPSSDIDVTFNRLPSGTEKESISYKITPEMETESTWLTNMLKIIPKNGMEIGTEYLVEIKIDNSLAQTFQFKTVLTAEEQRHEEGVLQANEDYAFGQTYKKFMTEYPWYKKIPIEKPDYRIVYDFEEKSFRIRLLKYFENSQIQTIIKKAILDLKDIGVEDPIKYYTLDFEGNQL